MLASRALSARLHPLTHRELADAGFLLDEVLRYGSIPTIYFAENKEESLRAYVDTYLKEEIQQKAILRKLDKLFSFIDIAAQLNGEIVNYSKMARQIGVADKTIGDYYQILLDTLLLIRLPGRDRSAKNRLSKVQSFSFLIVVCSTLRLVNCDLLSSGGVLGMESFSSSLLLPRYTASMITFGGTTRCLFIPTAHRRLTWCCPGQDARPPSQSRLHPIQLSTERTSLGWLSLRVSTLRALCAASLQTTSRMILRSSRVALCVCSTIEME
jgi:hypothetical protein